MAQWLSLFSKPIFCSTVVLKERLKIEFLKKFIETASFLVVFSCLRAYPQGLYLDE